jgi:beta-phosphoglucomutase-like phosphatase (HAD superfamily)
MTLTLQAIVFDYDGVLADTEPLHLRAFQETLATRGVELTSARYFDDYLGLDDAGVLGAVSAEHGLGWTRLEIRALTAEKAQRFQDLSSTERVLFAGAADRLRQWGRQVPIAIASGSLRHEIEHVLEVERLRDVVPVIVAAGETPNGKPAPDPYIRALELLGGLPGAVAVEAARCLAVEDSPWGIDSARGAGMRVIAVTTSYPAARLAAADVVVPGLASVDLPLLDAVVCSPTRARG